MLVILPSIIVDHLPCLVIIIITLLFVDLTQLNKFDNRNYSYYSVERLSITSIVLKGLIFSDIPFTNGSYSSYSSSTTFYNLTSSNVHADSSIHVLSFITISF